MGTSPATNRMGRKPARWIVPQHDAQQVRILTNALGIAAPAARVLLNRGYAEPDAARRFLRPDISDLNDPFLLADMEPAAERLRLAIERKESILLYGDYDVDGTCSIVVLGKAIELAGGTARFHIPHRLKDGYGMRSEVIDKLMDARPDVFFVGLTATPWAKGMGLRWQDLVVPCTVRELVEAGAKILVEKCIRADGGKIIGIGAATKGNTLLNYCRLDTDLISYITDASPLKIGKCMPGSHIPIVSDEQIDGSVTHALILPWNIADFLKAKLAHLGLRFYVPQVEPHPAAIPTRPTPSPTWNSSTSSPRTATTAVSSPT